MKEELLWAFGVLLPLSIVCVWLLSINLELGMYATAAAMAFGAATTT
jgi:hypothetical protein